MPILFVIDSFGKTQTLTAALNKLLSVPFRVVVTRGQFFDNPSSIRSLCIDEYMQETDRKPDARTVKRLQDAAADCQEVVLATDGDLDGEVIARDAWEVLRNVGNFTFTRLRLNALSMEVITAAWQNRDLFEPDCAIPGDTRRIIDRYISGTLSDFKKRIYVGRMQTALLSAIFQSQPAIGEVTLKLPAQDGGRPYSATVPVTSEEQAQSLLGMAASLPSCETIASDVQSLARPWSHGEAVIAIAEALHVSLQQAADLMYSLYERGRMSYPFSSAKAVSESASGILKMLASNHGIKFVRDRVPVAKSSDLPSSPAPLSAEIDIGSPIGLLSEEDQALSIICRNLVMAGYMALVNNPNTFRLPEWARDLPWQRIQNPLPWMKQAEAGYREYQLEAALLRLMLRYQLGHPLTQVQAINQFVARNLVDHEFHLTKAGEQCLAHAPMALRDLKASVAIEAAIERLPGSLTSRIASIMQAITDADQNKIHALIQRVNKINSLRHRYEAQSSVQPLPRLMRSQEKLEIQ